MEINDPYEHETLKVNYISESIKTTEIEDLIDEELTGCQCLEICTPPKCICIARSGAFYTFSDRFRPETYQIQFTNSSQPVYECNNNCKCHQNLCGNKLVQIGPANNLKIINTTKDLALITTKTIKQFTFVCEYAGEIITATEAKKRFEVYKKMALPHNYIFCINENFGALNNIKTFIDPTFYGNIGRFINHSCEPNCFLTPIRINEVIPRLYIFSKQNIEENEEITFDYGQDNGVLSEKPCLCLKQNCRKYLPYDGNILLTEDL